MSETTRRERIAGIIALGIKDGEHPRIIADSVIAEIGTVQTCPSEPAKTHDVWWQGGPHAGIRSVLTSTPPFVGKGDFRYARVDDPDSGEYIGLYVSRPEGEPEPTMKRGKR